MFCFGENAFQIIELKVYCLYRVQNIAEPTHPIIAALDHPSSASPERGDLEKVRKTSLRGGTTWQSPICRAALYVGDCHAITRNDAFFIVAINPLSAAGEERVVQRSVDGVSLCHPAIKSPPKTKLPHQNRRIITYG